MKTLVCLVLLAPAALADEPAIEALIAHSPIIVVAEPVLEKGRAPIGICSELVLVKYDVRFRLRRVLKADRELKADETILTRLALFSEQPEEDTRELKDGQSVILFLRHAEDGEESFANTSIWFGVMPYTKQKELFLERAVKEAADKKQPESRSRDESVTSMKMGNQNGSGHLIPPQYRVPSP